MKKKSLSVLALILFLGTAFGAEPTIEGPEKIAPYKIARFKAVGVNEADGVLWRVRPADPKNVPDFGNSGKRNGRELEVVAPPGSYTVELVVVRPGTPLEINEVTRAFTIGTAPAPKPNPDPKPPAPAPKPKPSVDAELVAKFKNAVEVDSKAAFPGGGDKAKAAKLSDVYTYAAGKLSSGVEADWPKNVGALFESVAAFGAAQGVPRPPYLAAVRAVAGDVLGSHDSTAALDAAKRADLAARFNRAAAALKEAAK